MCTWPDQPVTPVPDNVDLLPFSQCDISGSRHYQQASKTIPLSVHSSSASSETFFFPSVDVPEAEQPPTLASFPLFKQPALRRLPCWEPSELPVPVDVRTGTAIPSPQRVHGKKRGVGSGAAACSISSVPCPGICATCGRACPGSMTEFGVKRQRRRRQTVHRLLKGYSFPKLPSLTSVCTSETPTSLPGIKQQEVAVPSPGLLAQPCCSRTLQTSDYSSYSQQTGDEEVRVSEPTKVHASVTVSSSAQIPVPSPEGLTLAVAPSPSAEAASRCPKTPRPLDTPAPCLESVLRSGNGGSGLRKARPFKPDMNRAAVANWLRSSGFGNLRSKFGRFSGADMLRLNRRDFIQICGTQEGIRLSNAILQK
ncbi:unnamed protein product [Schistocephalus solidus]|uniref:SAM domain-containing protein n=1 Tax=Schistocephalus solidus TaxID=70667 RepID=A0A3P7CF52_SCHSO|nr:unnamed protein product [Schistocephalus solidus]